MPRKKHRLSWLYEDLPVGHATQTFEEDSLAVSPVEVVYMSDVLADIAPVEELPGIESGEAPKDAPAKAAPAEEYPVVEEAAPAEQYPVLDEAAPVEEYPIVEEAAPAEEYPIVDEAAPVEEYPIVEEAAPAKKYPVVNEAASAEECRILEEAPSTEEPPTAAEELAAYPPIEEARANLEPEAVQLKDVLCKSEADRSGEEAARDAEKLDNKSGEVVLICTSCTIMLFIEHDGPCPYSVISLMGSCHESYSWFLHTTCFSCVNEQKDEWTGREKFSNDCMAAFRAAILSEAFMKRTGWFEVAGRVCRRPLQMAMDEGRRSVAYVKIDVVREETTGNCRMRGLRSVGLGSEKGERTEIINSFVPGGFM